MRLKINPIQKIFEKPAIGLSVLGLSLTGCLSASPHYYGMAEKPVQVLQEKEKIGPIKVFLPFIPASLDRDVVVRRVGKYEVTLLKAVWSEPLSEQVAGTFAGDLGQALPNELIYRQNNIVAEKPKIGIDLTLKHFSLDDKGYAVIDGLASFTVHDDSGKRLAAKTRHFSWKSKKYADKGAQAEIDALSEGIAVWASDTASFLVNGGLNIQEAEEDAQQKKNEAEADQAEKEMRQQQEIASADAKLRQEQKKLKQSIKKK